MLKMLLVAVLMFLQVIRPQLPRPTHATQAPPKTKLNDDFFAVTAKRKWSDTEVSITYPKKTNLIWSCVIFRRPSEPDYLPSWCFAVERRATSELFIIPKWPPEHTNEKWEVMAIVQWDDLLTGYNFGYAETEWSEVR